MSGDQTTDVVQLLYAQVPDFNLAQVARDLAARFTPKAEPAPTLTWDCDDIAVLDFAGFRVVIGFTAGLQGRFAACITVATGQSPSDRQATKAQPLATACHTLADRVQALHPSDARQSQVLDCALSPYVIDRVVDALSPPPAAARSRVKDVSEPGDMDRLLTRLSSELTTRSPSVISTAIASATAKVRQSTDKTRSDPAASAAKPNTAKHSALFWRKGQPTATPTQPATKSAGPHSAPSELQAVRDALYAADMAQQGRAGGLVQQTRQALQSLTALPPRLAGALGPKGHGEGTAIDPSRKN
jgi:hypothetical protein